MKMIDRRLAPFFSIDEQAMANPREFASRVSLAAEGRGLEPPTPYGAPVLQTDAERAKSREKQHVSSSCQQIASSTEYFDPDLQAVIERWPGLPDAVKAGIVAMVNSQSAS